MKFTIVALCFALSLAGLTSSEKLSDHVNSLENPYQLVPSLCLLSPARGNCNSQTLRYFYNTTSRTCEAFIYSGCHGNGNNFDSLQCCLKTCRPNKNRNDNN
ncbi:kunitz-type protease inhibitor 3 [Phascolarctos cinereus]|uniref:Early lactation protein n=1 Tax=Phascolarctos cinereus TaxID=38626 RepID=I6MS67_PHACI|nr:kunitz-type protease inhibitor 3 [Phascolarctos cinereus]AEN62465.1 early lactation protein precursor [Phascolarctos cinereus]